MRRIVFSIAFFRKKLSVQSTPTSTKSRWKFYTQVGHRSFHTAWTQSRHADRPSGTTDFSGNQKRGEPWDHRKDFATAHFTMATRSRPISHEIVMRWFARSPTVVWMLTWSQ